MRILITLLFILLAIPLPVSFIGLITIKNIITDQPIRFGVGIIETLFNILTLFIAATYPITFIFSLIATSKSNTFVLLSFLPIIQVIIFIILFVLGIKFRILIMW